MVEQRLAGDVISAGDPTYHGIFREDLQSWYPAVQEKLPRKHLNQDGFSRILASKTS